MDFSFLQDKNFLNELEMMPIKIQYAKIILLDFKENQIQELQGRITAGSISVNSTSAVRRTLNLTMLCDETISNLTDIDNLISINKKFRVYIGYKNLVNGYEKYGDIVWFKAGVYVIDKASINSATNGYTINITANDKMVLLNGQVGGVFPATVIFHEAEETDVYGNVIKVYPTIYQIIYEAVTQYGGEHSNNIIISGLENNQKQFVKYIGSGGPMYLYYDEYYESSNTNNSTVALRFDLNNVSEENQKKFSRYEYGQTVGYEYTSFTYPGELTFQAGSNVQQLLDQIVKTLGNYEYFYDLDGHFVFQEKKNYLNNYYTPLIKDLSGKNYIQNFNPASKYTYILNSTKNTTSISNNPKYNEIKNDFIVWGHRTKNDGNSTAIRYHLAVDNKPQLLYRWIYKNEVKQILKCPIDQPISVNTPPLERFDIFYENQYPSIQTEFQAENILIKYYVIRKIDQAPIYYQEIYKLMSCPVIIQNVKFSDWREELYVKSLLDKHQGITEDYDEELYTEWRKIYDPRYPLNKKIEDNLEFVYDNYGWNIDIVKNPNNLNYWLDFIDTDSNIMKYSISNIGKRSKVTTVEKARSIYNEQIPDVVYLPGEWCNDPNYNLQEYRTKFGLSGQRYCEVGRELDFKKFSISSLSASCFDEIRNQLYQNLTYNTTVAIQTTPKFYLDINTVIQISDKHSGVFGDFVITSLTLPLGYKDMMTINATEALVRY